MEKLSETLSTSSTPAETPNLLHWILFHFWLKKSRNRGFDKCCQVIPIIHIADEVIVFGTLIRSLQDDFLQDNPGGFRHLHIEIIVADKAEKDALAVFSARAYLFIMPFLPAPG